MLAALLSALFLLAVAQAQAQQADPVTNLVATPGVNKLTVSWTNPSSAMASSHRTFVRWRKQGAGTWQSTGELSLRTTYEIGSLDGGTIYEVGVIAHNIDTQPAFNWVSTTGTPEAPPYTLSVDADPPCGSEVTDTSVGPTYALVLMPAPASETETQHRWIINSTSGQWLAAIPIRTSGSSIYISRENTFAQMRNAYPGFKGFEFRLKDNTRVTAQCPWTFSEQTTTDPVPPQPPPTNTPAPPTGSVPPTGGGPSPDGGAPPPAGPSDPTPDSDTPARCGESDREYLERFYEATGGDAWHVNENWNSEEPLDQWFGVGTDEDGEVISLRLSDNNLSGDMPTEELLCLNENTELKELALWDNEELSGEVPEELVLAVERAALRDIAEMLDINPEWFEDYEDPFNFEDWYEGVTTDDEGRVTELDLPGEIPESIRSQFKELREIMITTSSGGCALSPEGSSPFSLFLLTLVVFAVLGRKKARA